MGKSIQDTFPPPEEALKLEPEELAMFLLKYLNEEKSGSISRYNFTLQGTIGSYAGDRYNEVSKAMMEAWLWLEKAIMLAPKPGEQGRDWVFVTRRGKKLLSSSDLGTYTKGKYLPEEELDPVLARKVRPLFLKGDYDTAVFQAFKEVEIRVRTLAGLPTEVIGVDLMRKAFKADNGPLTDINQTSSEQEAVAHLFAGAIGLFKNPSSHRDVNFEDASEVAELILFANYLIRLAERHAKS